MLRHSEFDVRLPDLTDFEQVNTGALAFCHLVRLSLVLSEIEPHSNRGQAIESRQIYRLLQSLRSWFNNLPPELHLFDSNFSRRPYSRVINELHIVAYVAVILIYLLQGPHRERPDFCSAAIAASLCINQLYGEIIHRSEANHLLPIHSWFILFSVVPRYYCMRTLALHNQSIPIPEEHPIFARAVLSELAETYASAQWVTVRVEQMMQGVGEVLDAMGPGGRAALGTPGIDIAFPDVAVSPQFQDEHSFLFLNLFPIPDDYYHGLAGLRGVFEGGSGATGGETEQEQALNPAANLGWGVPWLDLELDGLNALPDPSLSVDVHGF